MTIITSRTRAAGAVALLASLALGLSACAVTVDAKKSDSPASPEPSASARSTSSQATPSPSGSSAAAQNAGGGPTADRMTPAGSKLSFGQSATILVTTGKPDKDYYDKQLFEVKVTSVEKASYADIAAMDKDSKYKGYTPFYIHSEITLKETLKPVKYVSWTDTGFKSLLAGGAPAGTLIIIGSFDKCPTASSFKALGDTRQSCSVALAPTGTEVRQVAYTGNSSNYPTYDLNPYTNKPLVWGA